MYFKSIDNLNKDIIKNLYKIPKDLDLIVGIPRSGLLVANLIALYLNAPLSDLNGFLNGRILETGKTRRRDNYDELIKNIKKVLVVEDSVASGKSILEAKNKIYKSEIKNIEFIYLAAYVTDEKKDLVDIYFDICPFPRVFEWNIMHHTIVENSCFDLDGVLCVDPDDEENDDGERYIKFLNNTNALFVPTKTIGNIVTCRLEKYRKNTENWLEKNNIRYNNLIMMNYKNKQERINAGNYSKYKSEQYKKSGAQLFIESNLKQAIEISKFSNRPVYCLEVRNMIYPNSKIENYDYGKPKEMLSIRIKRLIPHKIKNSIKKLLRLYTY